MKKETSNTVSAEPVVIADECGDTLWDEVLQQEVNACNVKPVSLNAALLVKNLQSGLSVNTETK